MSGPLNEHKEFINLTMSFREWSNITVKIVYFIIKIIKSDGKPNISSSIF